MTLLIHGPEPNLVQIIRHMVGCWAQVLLCVFMRAETRYPLM